MNFRSPTQHSVGGNEYDVLEAYGVNLPSNMDLNYIDFEFFSDDEDNTCVFIDPVLQAPPNILNKSSMDEIEFVLKQSSSASCNQPKNIVVEQGTSIEENQEKESEMPESEKVTESDEKCSLDKDIHDVNNDSMMNNISHSNLETVEMPLSFHEVIETPQKTVELPPQQPQLHQETMTKPIEMIDMSCQTEAVLISPLIAAIPGGLLSQFNKAGTPTTITVSPQHRSMVAQPIMNSSPKLTSGIAAIEQKEEETPAAESFQSSEIKPFSLPPPICTTTTVPAVVMASSSSTEPSSTMANATPTNTPTHQNSNNNSREEPLDLKISFLSFQIGDIALFVPVDDRKEHWMAFHSNRPYRFLAQESLDNFLSKDKQRQQQQHHLHHHLHPQTQPQQQHKERTRILGRIIFIDTFTANDDYNPYKLTTGTVFYICYIEPLLVPKKK